MHKLIEEEEHALRAAVEDASRHLDEAFTRLREKVPPPPGRTWAITAAGTVGLFPLGEGSDE